jgi:hypothetical protein
MILLSSARAFVRRKRMVVVMINSPFILPIAVTHPDADKFVELIVNRSIVSGAAQGTALVVR